MATNDNDQLKAQARRNAEILSNVVGKTVKFEYQGWDEERRLFREGYVCKQIVSVDVEYKPVPHVSVKFSDGTRRRFCSIGEFEGVDVLDDEYGSIYARLEAEGFAL